MCASEGGAKFEIALIATLLAGADATVPLNGTVVGPGGAPVAGAELILTSAALGDPPVVARTKSQADGRFRLDRPADLAARNRFVVPALWVVARGYRMAVVRFPGQAPADDSSIRVRLDPSAPTQVRVVRLRPSR